MEAPLRALLAAIALFLTAGLGDARADTYVVTTANPSGPGSLAQAILDSNSHAGQDSVAFNIPGSGVHLIDLSQGSLPQITDSVIIDGYTQPGAQPNTLTVGNDAVILIQLDGGLVRNNGNGLAISASNCLVRGLSFTGFQVGPSVFPYNITGGFGIQVLGAGTGNVIQGNFIGLYPDGLTPRANYVGIRVEGTYSMIGNNLIGGTEPAARNLISGNQSGAENFGAGTVFLGNYIGPDATGMKAVGNLTGLKIAGNDVVIGGSDAGSGNVISGNQFDAIDLGFNAGYRYTASGNHAVIQGNLIGTSADGSGSLGNGGAAVFLVRNPNSTIGGLDPAAGNVIAFNGRGVVISAGGSFGIGNSVLSNSIYANRTRGIILGHPTSNNGQSSPVITSETISNGVVTIRGTLQSTPATNFVLQFFADSQSLTSSEQTYLGSTNVLTNNNGSASFRVTFPVSDTNVVINATATDPGGNTSEFSRNPAYLQNISTRAGVGTGNNALIGGFITDFSQIIIRGIGPSLKTYGFSNVVADPTLELHDQAGAKIAFNDNWKDNQSQAAVVQQGGLAPADDSESAIEFHEFGSNTSTTAVLQGKDQTTGIGVVEAYFYASFYNSGFANLSSRGFVGTDADVMIGGFILGGGSEHPRIVVRAIGPSLIVAGVPNALADPVLELHDGNGLLIESNDNWTDAQEDDLQTVGLAPTHAAESAILTRLAAGAYTAIVRGNDNTTGVALVEVYNLR